MHLTSPTDQLQSSLLLGHLPDLSVDQVLRTYARRNMPASVHADSASPPVQSLFEAAARRSFHSRQFPSHLNDFVASCEMDDSTISFAVALEDDGDDLQFWDVYNDPLRQAAMKVEYESIMTNKIWSLVDLPSGKQAITSCWLCKK